MSADDTEPAVNIIEPVESAEGSARDEELTVQDKLRDTRKKNERLRMTKTLAEQVYELKKRSGAHASESAVPNGAPGVVTSSDAARELALSGSAREHLLESQIEQLSIQDLSNIIASLMVLCEKQQEDMTTLKAQNNEISTVSRTRQTENDNLNTVNRTLKTDNENLRIDNKKLQDENEQLYQSGINLAFENISWFIENENLKEKPQGDEVYANDNENRSAEDGETSTQVEPPELVRFSIALNCPVSCGYSVVFFILYMMGFRLCIRRFIAEVQCALNNKFREAKLEVGKCSLSLTEFLKVGLIDEMFARSITDEYKIGDALREAKERIQGQLHPAAFMIEYEEGPDGRKPIGHCVAVMPDGKVIDVEEGKYWEANSESRISYIYVVNVKESEVIEWQHKCALQKCEAECTKEKTKHDDRGEY
ncbi:Hypothetical predicted protein [Paramuricea clavata]|uniref:Uncharacterized protein n=1 Tax=Paramuricea clavata TaxID=317549 RepID=A0A7D9DAZ1_PARCT|nr:Hypothetical predicted protein [Paramuricea clavata]